MVRGKNTKGEKEKPLTPTEKLRQKVNWTTVAFVVIVLVLFGLGLAAWLHQNHENDELRQLESLLNQSLTSEALLNRALKYRISMLKQKGIVISQDQGNKVKQHHLDYYLKTCILRNDSDTHELCERYWQKLEKSCDKQHINCNTSIVDRCEVRHVNDNMNCGACGNVCPMGSVCRNSMCGPPQALTDALEEEGYYICPFLNGLVQCTLDYSCCYNSGSVPIDCTMASSDAPCGCPFGYQYVEGVGCEVVTNDCDPSDGRYIGCGSSCCYANQASTVYCDQDTQSCSCPEGYAYIGGTEGCVLAQDAEECATDLYCNTTGGQVCYNPQTSWGTNYCTCQLFVNECGGNAPAADSFSFDCNNPNLQASLCGGDCDWSTDPNMGPCNVCKQGYQLCSTTGLCIEGLDLTYPLGPCLDNCCDSSQNIVCNDGNQSCVCQEGYDFCGLTVTCNKSSSVVPCGHDCCSTTLGQVCNSDTQTCECETPGDVFCPGVGCVSLTNNTYSCGGCGFDCHYKTGAKRGHISRIYDYESVDPSSVTCQAGQCVIDCPSSNPTLCYMKNGLATCSDTSGDYFNCGSCGNSCFPDLVGYGCCSGGQCTYDC